MQYYYKIKMAISKSHLKRGFDYMDIKITFDSTIPQLVEVVKFKMYELDVYAEIVNGLKRELEKNVTIRGISKNAIAGGYSIDFDINDEYFISVWTNGLYRMNTVIVSLYENYESPAIATNINRGELRISYNPDEPVTCDEEDIIAKPEFVNELWPKVVSAVHTVINKMNEKRS